MPVCQADGDCASKLACLSNECKNPCYEIRPCGANAECIVVDTLPLRTMSCQCLPGFIGDADIECTRGELFKYITLLCLPYLFSVKSVSRFTKNKNKFKLN